MLESVVGITSSYEKRAGNWDVYVEFSALEKKEKSSVGCMKPTQCQLAKLHTGLQLCVSGAACLSCSWMFTQTFVQCLLITQQMCFGSYSVGGGDEN